MRSNSRCLDGEPVEHALGEHDVLARWPSEVREDARRTNTPRLLTKSLTLACSGLAAYLELERDRSAVPKLGVDEEVARPAVQR